MKQKSTGSNATASAVGSSKSKADDALPPYPFYAICVEGYGPFLQVGFTYKVVKPLANDPPHMLRVIDGEGEDYLYSRRMFVVTMLPVNDKRRLSKAIAPGETRYRTT